MPVKIYSLALILPLGLLSGQALAFYQQPAALNERHDSQRTSAHASPFQRMYASQEPAVKAPPYTLAAIPVPGCNCPFCTLLRQAG